MDDREQQRKIRHRLAVLRHAEEVSGNVAATCRYYGISRTLFYKWRNRFDELGAEGLRDRSSRPHHSPTATKGEVVERIVGLRQNYHFGPARIAMYLKRYHDVEISPSRVWRVLPRLGLGRRTSATSAAPSARSGTRNSGQATGCRSTSSSVAPIDGVTTKRHYQFTVIDDCTRLRVLRIYPKADQRTAIAFGDYVAERLPFPIEVIQTDNGAEESSADSSTASPTTTPTCSTTGSERGRTTTTSDDPTAASTVRPPTGDSKRKALRLLLG